MRRSLAATAAVVLSVSLIASPALAAKKKPVKELSTTTITKAVTVNGILKHQRRLQVIADRNGGNRASGEPGYDASADYVAAQLKKAGYTVTRQRFTFPSFEETAPTTLTQLTPTARELETAILDYSGSGDVTGTVVPTTDVQVPPGAEANSSSSGCEAADFAAAPAEPSIALVQRGTCDFLVKSSNAAAAGYDAVVVFNEGQEDRTDVIAGTLGEPVDIPVVGVSYADGADLVTLAREGVVTARVDTLVEVDLDRETENVIADVPRPKGGKLKNTDEVVVVGAHLDSVLEGPGINDNGSGTSTILETAIQMKDKGLLKKLQRPVRFAFWGAEERGLLGAYHYVENLSDVQRSKIYANLNFDMLGSPNYARFVYDGDGSAFGEAGPAGSTEIERVFKKYFRSKSLGTSPTAFDGRSDYGPFIEVGIPAGGLFSGAEGIKTAREAELAGGTAGQPYDACYHLACDDISNLSTKALQELGDGAAFATVKLTLSVDGLYGDARKAQLKKIRAGKTLSGSPKGAHGHDAR